MISKLKISSWRSVTVVSVLRYIHNLYLNTIIFKAIIDCGVVCLRNKLIYSIFVKVLVNCSRGNGVKLIRAIEHICLYNSKAWDRGILLKTVGGGVGSVSCDSSLYLTESCFIFSTIFQTWRRINCLILCHTDKVKACWCIFLAFQ